MFYLYKYVWGFTAVPFTLISKCKCGPVEFPVEPTAAIISPASTCWPSVAYNSLQCPYQVSTPFSCEIFIKFPYEPLLAANVTVPAATAFIGVPLGAAISVPVCAPDLILLTAPNLEVIVPVTGVTAKSTPLTTGDLPFSSSAAFLASASFLAFYSASFFACSSACFLACSSAISAETFSSTWACATCTASILISLIFSV